MGLGYVLGFGSNKNKMGIYSVQLKFCLAEGVGGKEEKNL